MAGVSRAERRATVERFMQDPALTVLVANDAAGEGVNLQRAHLMVNYDLPWNPNRIEQRFGRIHRIGQTEVCHLWNLVAAETREGEVYARLLEKLERARAALGGRVYDVLGQLFEGTSLRDLLVEAVRYGERADVKARLFRAVDGAADQAKLLDLLARRALTQDGMTGARVAEMRLEMERAAALRLQPHHVQGFFVEALERLGGRIRRREEGRFEITHVPARVRDARPAARGAPLQSAYERVCFARTHVDGPPPAALISPGAPLLEAVVACVLEDGIELLVQGAVLVDDADLGVEPRAVFLLDHAVHDARETPDGQAHVVSRRLQFASLTAAGAVSDAGPAPHLDLRPMEPDERALAAAELEADWLAEGEHRVARFADAALATAHLDAVRRRRLPEIDLVARQVQARLTREVNYWDGRAIALREAEAAGRKTRVSPAKAERRANLLAERRERRMAAIRAERALTSGPARILGGFVAVPRGLLDARRAMAEAEGNRQTDLDTDLDTDAGLDADVGVDADVSPDRSARPVRASAQAFTDKAFADNAFADKDQADYEAAGHAASRFGAPDPEARRAVELAAMAAVLAAEEALGHAPRDVSAENRGYDIEALDARTGRLRFIEVKGRIAGADTVSVTRNEVIASLNAPDQFILAVVVVEGLAGAPDRLVARAPLYVHGALDDHEPRWEDTSVTKDLGRLLKRAVPPGQG